MSSKAKACEKCGGAFSSGKFIVVGHHSYHPDCFQCNQCKLPINGSYVEHRDNKLLYHPQCMEVADEQQAILNGKVCKGCNKACFRGKYLTLGTGHMFHAQCFTCIDCNQCITGSYLSYGDESIPLHEACARKRDNARAIAEGKVCKRCGKPCVEGQIMNISSDEMYHARCFSCTHCKKSIEGKFAQHGPDNLPYHMDCLTLHQNKLNASNSTNKLNGSSSSSKIGIRGTGPEKPRMCKKCNVECSTGLFYSTASATYHADCFRCSDLNCNGLITGKYTEHGEPLQPYHPACGKELFAPRCILCTHTMEGQFFRHPFFESEIYCMSHESVPSCFACLRKDPLPSSHREGFVDLMDGRSLCVQCSSSIIVDSSEAQALYLGIVEFMGRELGLPIPPEMRDVPVLLVDIQSLNENRSRLGDVLGHHHEDTGETLDAVDSGKARPAGTPIGASVQAAKDLIQQRATQLSSKAASRGGAEGIIRGVTLSTCAQVRYLPSTGLQFDQSRKSLVARPQLPEIYHMKQVRDVTAVLVLYGLPRDLTASILAHEAMHVWLKLNKDFPFRMQPKLEEGLCQVISFLYLESVVAKIQAEHAPTVGRTTASSAQKMTKSPSVPDGANVSTGSKLTAGSRPRSRPGSGQSNGARAAFIRPSSAASARLNKNKQDVKTLAHWFKQQIVIDKSPIYGEGFKEVNKHVSALGLQTVLGHIKRHQALPTARTKIS